MHKYDLTKIILRWESYFRTRMWVNGKYLGVVCKHERTPLKLAAPFPPKFQDWLQKADSATRSEIMQRMALMDPGDAEVFFVNETTGKVYEEDDLD